MNETVLQKQLEFSDAAKYCSFRALRSNSVTRESFLSDDVLCDVIALSWRAAFLWIVISHLFRRAYFRSAYVAHDLFLCGSEMHSGSR